MNIVELKNVKKSFGSKEILKDITMEIKQGERLTILGPNGSGKSTLINVILGLTKKSGGEILYPANNNSVKDFVNEVGIQFQSGNFPASYKVKEVIEVIMEQSTDFSYKNYFSWKKESKKKIEELLEVFQITKIAKNKVSAISGGQKQRLNILLALISKPKVLILDEISTGLDIGSQKKLIKFISDYVKKEKATLVIVSHILFEIEQLTNNVVMLDEGIIKFRKTIKSLETKHGSLSSALDKYFVEGEEI